MDYFNLSEKEKRNYLNDAADLLSIPANMIEKDIWICSALDRLFKLSMPMAFKGGTSLSKVFNLIDRFSEDIDVTIDYRHLGVDLKGLGKSRSQNKKIGELLLAKVKEYRDDVIVPVLKELGEIKVDESGEKIWLKYHSVLPDANYIQEDILIELGGRNIIDPNKTHFIQPYLVKTAPHLILPQAKVVVLSPEKTFLEKITLAHKECKNLRKNGERLSRHWYDLVKLSEVGYCDSALKDLKLLREVVRNNEVFFFNKVDYQDCLNGRATICPTGDVLKRLQEDYKEMKHSGMIFDEMTFEEIVERIQQIEIDFNQTVVLNAEIEKELSLENKQRKHI